MLRAPDENLTADQVNQILLDPNSQGLSTGNGNSGTQLATALPLATTPGFAPDTRFQSVASLNGIPDPVYYSLVAPAATGNNPLVLTAGLNAAGPGGDTGSLELLDASGATSLDGAPGRRRRVHDPGHRSDPRHDLLSLRKSPTGASNSSGNSILVADFLQTSAIQTTFESTTLSTAAPQSTSTLYVARSQFFQFQLSVATVQGGASGAVAMTIFNQNGIAVLDVTATAGEAGTVSCVMLPPGQYTVVFSAITIHGSLPALTYTVRGGVLSQPMGPVVHNPTYQPLYLASPGPIPTYRYPNGALSTIPFLWLANYGSSG